MFVDVLYCRAYNVSLWEAGAGWLMDGETLSKPHMEIGGFPRTYRGAGGISSETEGDVTDGLLDMAGRASVSSHPWSRLPALGPGEAR